MYILSADLVFEGHLSLCIVIVKCLLEAHDVKRFTDDSRHPRVHTALYPLVRLKASHSDHFKRLPIVCSDYCLSRLQSIYLRHVHVHED
mgnify:CR=1 FL=1